MGLLSCARLESIGGSSSRLNKVESFSDQCDPGCRRFQFGHISIALPDELRLRMVCSDARELHWLLDMQAGL